MIMKLLCEDKEIGKVNEKLNLNIQEIANYFDYFEKIYSFIKNSKSNMPYDFIVLLIELNYKDNYIEYIRNVVKKEYRESSFDSLVYYLMQDKKMILNFRKEKYHNFNRYRYLIIAKGIIYSVINLMNYLIEYCFLTEYYFPNPKKRKILIFESCPEDLNYIDGKSEVFKLRSLFINDNSLYYPIVRFNTNLNIFKNTCLGYKIDILHFIGHGEGNGDLCFTSLDGKHKFLGYETLLKFFNNTYFPAHNNNVLLGYFNSCYSSKICTKLVRDSTVFNSLIGCVGINSDLLAIKFAYDFYKKIFNKNILSFNKKLDIVKNEWSSSMNDKKIDYINKITAY